jgi:NADH:ubiquinone oxidoreductase subunit 2 (subunit N)
VQGEVAILALAGAVISIYYYFGVIRAIYWSRDAARILPSSRPAATARQRGERDG